MEKLLRNRSSLGNPLRPWRQTFLPITTFRAYHGNQDPNAEKTALLCKEAGFDVLEYQTNITPEDLKIAISACEKAEIRFFIQDFRYFGGFQDSRAAPWDPEKIPEMVELYRRHPLMFGYYVWDEPYPQQYPMAREQVDRIQGCDPEHIAYTVALPSYNERYRWDNGKFEEYLREYARVIQPSVLALDYYPFFWEAVTPQDLDRSQLYNDIGLLRRIALDQDTPMWFYFQCWPHVQKERQMTGAQVRCQLYNALLYGAKGLQYYIIYPYIVTPEGEKGCLFDQVKELNHEVRALRNTLLALTSRRVYHGGEVNDRFAQSWEEDPVLAKLEDGFSAGRFDDGYGNDYLLWQNRDFERAKTGCLTLRRPMRVYEVDKKDGCHRVLADRASRLTLDFAPGDGRLLRVESPEESPCSLAYEFE